jgi:hypothetical protein
MKTKAKKIRAVFFTIILFISCHKFEENILLFKNVSVFLNSTTWELISFTKNGQIIFTNEKYKKYNEKSDTYLFKEGGNLGISTPDFDSIKGKYYHRKWKIVKLNSKFLKIMRKDSANNVYLKHYKVHKVENDLYYD